LVSAIPHQYRWCDGLDATKTASNQTQRRGRPSPGRTIFARAISFQSRCPASVRKTVPIQPASLCSCRCKNVADRTRTMAEPVAACADTVFDECRMDNVPCRSTSSSGPARPSNRMRLPSRRFAVEQRLRLQVRPKHVGLQDGSQARPTPPWANEIQHSPVAASQRIMMGQ